METGWLGKMCFSAKDTNKTWSFDLQPEWICGLSTGYILAKVTNLQWQKLWLSWFVKHRKSLPVNKNNKKRSWNMHFFPYCVSNLKENFFCIVTNFFMSIGQVRSVYKKFCPAFFSFSFAHELFLACIFLFLQKSERQSLPKTSSLEL